MKKLKFPVFILILLFQSAFCFAQQTKTPFTVTVFNTVGTAGALGTKITANSQMLANTVYYVEVASSTTGILCCMRMTNADGFTTGSYSSNVWVPRANPTGYQADLGAVKKMGFYIKTFSSPDFVSQLYMKISQCRGTAGPCTNPGGSGWVNLTLFLFPYL